MSAALLTAVARTGAACVMLGNTYGYGQVDGPMTQGMPMAAITVKGFVRTQMWLDALAAHEAGRAQVTEVRAGGFLGAGAVGPYDVVPARERLPAKDLVDGQGDGEGDRAAEAGDRA